MYTGCPKKITPFNYLIFSNIPTKISNNGCFLDTLYVGIYTKQTCIKKTAEAN